MAKRIAVGVCMALVTLSWLTSPAFAQATNPTPQAEPPAALPQAKRAIQVHGLSKREELLHAELENNSEADFFETPLDEVAAYIEDVHSITIMIDDAALQAAHAERQLASEQPITLVLRGNSLRNILTLTLRQIDADWTVERGVVVITTRDKVASNLITRMYDLSPLLLDVDDPAELQRLFHLAKEALRREALARDEKGDADEKAAKEEATMEPIAGQPLPRNLILHENLLVVRDDRYAHEEVYDLLMTLLEKKYPGQSQRNDPKLGPQRKRVQPPMLPLKPKEPNPFDLPSEDPFAPQ